MKWLLQIIIGCLAAVLFGALAVETVVMIADLRPRAAVLFGSTAAIAGIFLWVKFGPQGEWLQ